MDGFREQEQERNGPEQHQDGGQDNAPAGPQAMQPMNDPEIVRARERRAEEAEEEQKKKEKKAEKDQRNVEAYYARQRIAVNAAKAKVAKAQRKAYVADRTASSNNVAQKLQALQAAEQNYRNKKEEADAAEALARAEEAGEEADQARQAARNAKLKAEIAEEELKRKRKDFEEARVIAEEATIARNKINARAQNAEEAGRIANNKAEQERKALAKKRDKLGEEENRLDQASKAIVYNGTQKHRAEERAEGIEELREHAAEFGEEEFNRELGENGDQEGDDFDEEILRVAAQVGRGDVGPGEEGAEDRKFDTLNDLKGLAKEDALYKVECDNQVPQNQDPELRELRRTVLELRKGNLYKTVIIRMNPNTAAEAVRQQRGNAFSRFMDNSMVNALVDWTGKGSKSLNAVSGTRAIFDEDYAKSTGSVISAINDGVILVTTTFGIINKIRNFKKNNITTMQKVFAGISLTSDFLMVIAKLASLSKFFNDKTKLGKILPKGFSDVADKVSKACTIMSQTLGLAGAINSLKETIARRIALKKDQKEEEKEVRQIVEKIENQGNNNGGHGENNEDQGEDEQEEAGGNETLKERVRNVYAAADDHQKEVLGSYLGRARVLTKSWFDIVNASIGLITSAAGLGTSIAKNVSASDEDNKTAKNFANGFGIATNAGTFVSNAIMPAIGKGMDLAGLKDGEQIAGGLLAAVDELKSNDDKYGLRGIAAELRVDNPSDDEKSKAKNAVARYNAVAKRFSGSGVNYNKLFEATSHGKDFEKALVAAL